MGIVSTNVPFIGGSGNGSGGANSADLPTHLKSLAANGGNGFVTLALEYENTDYLSGIQVNYKTGDYPTSPNDGDSVSVTGVATSIKVEGLTNKLTYYFRAFPYNEVDGVKYFQTDLTNARVTCIPRAVEIIGVTPVIEGDGYMVIDASCTFTISAPAGTKIIIGGGGDSGESGYDYNDEDSQYNYVGQSGQASTLRINGITYNSGSARNTIATKAGKIGGGGKGGDGGDGAKNTSGYLGWGGRGGNGGRPNGSGGKGGVGKRSGDGGSSGNGTPGASNNTTGGSPGAVGEVPGVYSYGGDGGNGEGGNKGVSAQYTGCMGGNGGPGGCVAEYTLPIDLINAPCVLTIGKGGVFTAWDYENECEYRVVHPGKDGGDGVLVIEW